jgi:hypothetical protein
VLGDFLPGKKKSSLSKQFVRLFEGMTKAYLVQRHYIKDSATQCG